MDAWFGIPEPPDVVLPQTLTAVQPLNGAPERCMTTSTTGALAIELQPHSPTQWIATYYPLAVTPADRWAEVTWVLHQRLILITPGPSEPARWLDARSPDPSDACYANHRSWSAPLAAGYAEALAVHEAEATEEPLSSEGAQQLRDDTVVVPAGQLSKWVLDDLEDETTGIRG